MKERLSRIGELLDNGASYLVCKAMYFKGMAKSEPKGQLISRLEAIKKELNDYGLAIDSEIEKIKELDDN